MSRVTLRLLLLAVVIVSLARPGSAMGQFPEREPTVEELRFGCDPGPSEPFYRADPPLPPRPLPDEDTPVISAELVVDGSLTRPPIEGSGFNLEHTLWSCPTFRPALRRRILEPFRPSVMRIDTGQLPFAPTGKRAEALGWDDYQRLMDDRRYQPSWEMLRRLNRRGVKLMLGVWGAPGAFTSDGTRRGALLPERHEQYVEYYAAMVDYLVRRQGIEVWTATVMNEPDGGDGTYIAPDEFVEVARLLGPRLAAYDVKLYGPDTASAETALEYLRPLLDEPDVMQHFAAIGAHQYFPSPYTERLVETIRGSGYELPVYVTEYTSFHFGDLDRGESAHDEIGMMLDIAATAVSLYNDGVDAALYWDAVDYYQAGHAAVTAWGLLAGPDKAFFPRRRYFGMLQLLPYLQPGARVVSTYLRTEAELSALAIRPPGDGLQDLAVALVNVGGPIDLELTLLNLRDIEELQVYLTDEDHEMQRIGHLAFRRGRASLYLPARSIVTLAPAPAPDEP